MALVWNVYFHSPDFTCVCRVQVFITGIVPRDNVCFSLLYERKYPYVVVLCVPVNDIH